MLVQQFAELKASFSLSYKDRIKRVMHLNMRGQVREYRRVINWVELPHYRKAMQEAGRKLALVKIGKMSVGDFRSWNSNAPHTPSSSDLLRKVGGCGCGYNLKSIGELCDSCHRQRVETALVVLAEKLYATCPNDTSYEAIIEHCRVVEFYPGLSQEKDGYVAYSRYATISVIDSQKRTRQKVGKFLNKLRQLGLPLTDTDIAKWVGLFCQCDNPENWTMTIKPFETSDYAAIDDNDRLSSCMTGDHSEKTELYEANNDIVHFCTWHCGNTMLARALAFKNEDGLFLGRVYISGAVTDCTGTVREAILKSGKFAGKWETQVWEFNHSMGSLLPYFDNYMKITRIDESTIRVSRHGEYATDQYGDDPTACRCENCNEVCSETTTVHLSQCTTSEYCDICLSGNTFEYNGEYYSDDIETVQVPHWLA